MFVKTLFLLTSLAHLITAFNELSALAAINGNFGQRPTNGTLNGITNDTSKSAPFSYTLPGTVHNLSIAPPLPEDAASSARQGKSLSTAWSKLNNIFSKDKNKFMYDSGKHATYPYVPTPYIPPLVQPYQLTQEFGEQTSASERNHRYKHRPDMNVASASNSYDSPSLPPSSPSSSQYSYGNGQGSRDRSNYGHRVVSGTKGPQRDPEPDYSGSSNTQYDDYDSPPQDNDGYDTGSSSQSSPQSPPLSSSSSSSSNNNNIDDYPPPPLSQSSLPPSTAPVRKYPEHDRDREPERPVSRPRNPQKYKPYRPPRYPPANSWPDSYSDWEPPVSSSESERGWLSSLFGGYRPRPNRYRSPFLAGSELSFTGLPSMVDPSALNFLRGPSMPAFQQIRPGGNGWFNPRPMATAFRPTILQSLYGGFGQRPGPPPPQSPFFGASSMLPVNIRPFNLVPPPPPMMGSPSMSYPVKVPYMPMQMQMHPFMRSPFQGATFTPLRASDMSFAESSGKPVIVSPKEPMASASQTMATVVSPPPQNLTSNGYVSIAEYLNAQPVTDKSKPSKQIPSPVYVPSSTPMSSSDLSSFKFPDTKHEKSPKWSQATNMLLEDLPNELILEICTHVRAWDVLSLEVVSKRFQRIANSYLQTVTDLDLRVPWFITDKSLKQTNMAEQIKKFILTRCGPCLERIELNSNFQLCIMYYSNAEFIEKLAEKCPKLVKLFEVDLGMQVKYASLSERGLKNLTLPLYGNPPLAQLSKLVVLCPELSTLSMRFGENPSLSWLVEAIRDRPSHLKKLTIAFSDLTEQFIEEIAELSKMSPNLKVLHLQYFTIQRSVPVEKELQLLKSLIGSVSTVTSISLTGSSDVLPQMASLVRSSLTMLEIRPQNIVSALKGIEYPKLAELSVQLTTGVKREQMFMHLDRLLPSTVSKIYIKIIIEIPQTLNGFLKRNGNQFESLSICTFTPVAAHDSMNRMISDIGNNCDNLTELIISHNCTIEITNEIVNVITKRAERLVSLQLTHLLISWATLELLSEQCPNLKRLKLWVKMNEETHSDQAVRKFFKCFPNLDRGQIYIVYRTDSSIFSSISNPDHIEYDFINGKIASKNL
ncbi:hypothetical protein HDE_07323 [Halotydeus destructor]|nr:hypothetical protein HDE_07323 [Halotydeus destructor]